MVLCPGCHNFVGNPCACCRTASRIQFFLTRTQFPPAVEGRLVGILRQAVGEITDVAEQLGSFRTAPPPGAVAGAPDGPGGTKTEEVVKEEKSEAPVEKVKKEKKKDKAKKASKDKKRDEKKREAASGAKEAPVEEKEEPKEEEVDAESLRRDKAAPLVEVRRGAGQDRPDLQESVDKYVAKHPEKFGLGSLSVRGSAAKYFRANDGEGRERPPEPRGLPPSRRPTAGEQPHPRGERRQRSRTPKRKSKGTKHRQRGRDYWRQVQERDRWRRRFNQQGRQGPERGQGHR